MANLLGDAVAKLDAICQAYASSAIVYRRATPATPISIVATRGRSKFEQVDRDGAVTKLDVEDFIISAADLVISGSRTTPTKGDEIDCVGPDGRTYTYAVASVGSEPCWRWTDGYCLAYRVHTKLKGSA